MLPAEYLYCRFGRAEEELRRRRLALPCDVRRRHVAGNLSILEYPTVSVRLIQPPVLFW